MKIETKEISQGKLITIQNKAGLELRLSEVGAGVYFIGFDGKPMSSGPQDIDLYLRNNGAFYGKTVAPIAGRVPKATFIEEGKEYHLDVNDHGLNCLHSGSFVVSMDRFESRIEEKEGGVRVVFSRFFPHKEGVYPADVDLQVSYEMNENEAKFVLRIEAKLSAKAPFNPTNHLYFALGGEPSVLKDKLTVRSNLISYFGDAELLPTRYEEAIPELDFRAGKEAGKDIASPALRPVKGYDHAFFLDHEEGKFDAYLENEDYAMGLKTNAPAFQIYVTGWPDPSRLLWNGYEHEGCAITFEPVSRMNPLAEMEVGPNVPFRREVEYSFFRKKGTK